jgi:hypothetical protein
LFLFLHNFVFLFWLTALDGLAAFAPDRGLISTSSAGLLPEDAWADLSSQASLDLVVHSCPS